MTIYDFSARTIDGKERSLADFRGEVLLIVNVASRCGYTPQYRGLEALYQKYRDQGFSVLGFPCDQFGHQEPGTEEQIATFCETTYQVTFPLFGKVDVNGPNAHPLWRYLKSARKGILGSESIKWNFTKFLVSRDGEVVDRFGSRDTPEAIEADVLPLLDRIPPTT